MKIETGLLVKNGDDFVTISEKNSFILAIKEEGSAMVRWGENAEEMDDKSYFLVPDECTFWVREGAVRYIVLTRKKGSDVLKTGRRQTNGLEFYLRRCISIQEMASGENDFEILLKQEIEADRLLLDLLEEQKLQEKAMNKKATIEDVYDYINGHFAEDIAIDEVANAFRYSKSYMMHCFKDKYFISINQYIKELRLAEAKKKLVSSEKTLDIIAGECGFHSVAYFIKTFREKEKCTPMEYRDKTKNFKIESGNFENPYQYKTGKMKKAVMHRVNMEE